MSRYNDRRQREFPPKTDGMISLKVDNLTYRTSMESLRRAFSRFGEIGDIYIPRDRYTFESRGFAFVRYLDQRDADDAIDAMDGHLFDGRELRVQLAKHPRPTNYGKSRRSRSRSYTRSRRRSRSRSRTRSRSRRSRSRSRSRNRRSSRDKRSRSRSRDRRRDKSEERSRGEKSPKRDESPNSDADNNHNGEADD